MEYIDISDIEINKELPKINFNINDHEYELACSVFASCNLRCKFCFQEHMSKLPSVEDVYKIPKQMYLLMKPEFEKYDIEKINLKIWGGELFMDSLPISFFDAYEYLFFEFQRLVLQDFPYMKIHPVWLTNGIFTRKYEVYNLIKKTNGSLGFSYDPEGRFNTQEQFRQWVENYMYFDHCLGKIIISITPTKSNIKSYIMNNSLANFFTQNMKNTIDISYYTAGKNYLEDTPDDEDMFQFYKWLVDNKVFNCYVIDNIFKVFDKNSNHPMYCNCKKAIQYQDGYCIKNCALRASRSLPQEMFYGKYKDEITEENCTEYKNSLGILKRGCLYCKWYEKCQKTCWISILSSAYKISECPLKRIYEYIESNDYLIKDWKRYNETHVPSSDNI